MAFSVMFFSGDIPQLPLKYFPKFWVIAGEVSDGNDD